ncbi:MAG: hypothetical protein H6Q68_2575 [Firmicutes bacterium]|nr:hypothetical protein [Bacillota bacterium]
MKLHMEMKFSLDLINLLTEIIQVILEYVYIIPNNLSEVQNKF